MVERIAPEGGGSVETGLGPFGCYRDFVNCKGTDLKSEIQIEVFVSELDFQTLADIAQTLHGKQIMAF